MLIKNWLILLLGVILVFQLDSRDNLTTKQKIEKFVKLKQIKELKKKNQKIDLKSYLNGIWMRIGKRFEKPNYLKAYLDEANLSHQSSTYNHIYLD
jgi:hypothetical protein